MPSIRTRVRRRVLQTAWVIRSTEAPSRMRTKLSALHELSERVDDDLFAGNDLSRYELSVFSQNGEDGVICEIMRRIGAKTHYFIEFGIETGLEGNCVFLADVLGWSGLFIEGDPASHAKLSRKYEMLPVTTLKAMVTPENADATFLDAGAPEEPDILSIDIDGNDIWVWNGIKQLRPRLLIIEYNSSLDHSTPVCQTYSPDEGWNGSAGFGTSLAALDILAGIKGYTLVHTDLAGVNAFYVRDDLVSLVGVESPPRRATNYRLEGISHPAGEPPSGWTTVTSSTFADAKV